MVDASLNSMIHVANNFVLIKPEAFGDKISGSTEK